MLTLHQHGASGAGGTAGDYRIGQGGIFARRSRGGLLQCHNARCNLNGKRVMVWRIIDCA
jgi:hypothetical protein